MNGWIQTYNDESEKQKKQQQQHQNPFTFPNISDYILFKTDEIYFQKAQRKNLIGKIYLVK